MFEKVNALLESDGSALVENYGDTVFEAIALTTEFQKDLKIFILNNPEEFIGENVEETYKNMRVFAEVGTAQFVSEVSNIYGGMIQESIVTEAANADRGLAEYL
jgi:hypothetical protein